MFELSSEEFHTLYRWRIKNVAVVADVDTEIFPASPERVALALPSTEGPMFYGFGSVGGINQGLCALSTGTGWIYLDIVTHGKMVQQLWAVDSGFTATLTFYEAVAPIDAIEAFQRQAEEKVKRLNLRRRVG